MSIVSYIRGIQKEVIRCEERVGWCKLFNHRSEYLGGMYVVSKYALDYIEPFTFIWIRYLVHLWRYSDCGRFFGRESIRRQDWKWIVWIGDLVCGLDSFQFIGTKLSMHIPAR